MKHINKILLLFIFILTFISCNFSVKNNETKKLYIVDYRIYKFQTDKNFIGAVTFLYSNDEDTVRYLMNHQKRCNIINSNYKRKNICTNYKFIAPNKKNPNLFIIREVFCEENGFNNYTRKQLDSLETALSKDVQITISFLKGEKNIVLSKNNKKSDSVIFNEIVKFNPNDWFDTKEIDTLKNPPPPPVYIVY